jgi:hypothetical protein
MPDFLFRLLRRDPLFFFAWAALGGNRPPLLRVDESPQV